MTFSALLQTAIDPYTIIRFMHFAGAVIAVGAVTVTDSMLLLLHFKERFAPVFAKLSAILSLVVWSGLFLLSTTGIYLISQYPENVHGWFFQTKMVLVSIVVLNGIILNEKVNPRFKELADDWKDSKIEVTKFERFAGVFALISILGWWTILLFIFVNGQV